MTQKLAENLSEDKRKIQTP